MDNNLTMAIKCTAITLLAIILIVAVAAILATNRVEITTGQPTCPAGYVATYIQRSGWICTIAPVTP
jgi:hypothetical protein